MSGSHKRKQPGHSAAPGGWYVDADNFAREARFMEMRGVPKSNERYKIMKGLGLNLAGTFEKPLPDEDFDDTITRHSYIDVIDAHGSKYGTYWYLPGDKATKPPGFPTEDWPFNAKRFWKSEHYHNLIMQSITLPTKMTWRWVDAALTRLGEETRQAKLRSAFETSKILHDVLRTANDEAIQANYELANVWLEHLLTPKQKELYHPEYKKEYDMTIEMLVQFLNWFDK